MTKTNGINFTMCITLSPGAKAEGNFGTSAMARQSIKLPNVTILILSFTLILPEDIPWDPEYTNIEVRCRCSRHRTFELNGFHQGGTRFECRPLHRPDAINLVPFTKCDYRMYGQVGDDDRYPVTWIPFTIDSGGPSVIKTVRIDAQTVGRILPRTCMIDPCTICQESITHDDIVKAKCKHYFHPHCIADWLKVNPTCPLCRSPFQTSICV